MPPERSLRRIACSQCFSSFFNAKTDNNFPLRGYPYPPRGWGGLPRIKRIGPLKTEIKRIGGLWVEALMAAEGGLEKMIIVAESMSIAESTRGDRNRWYSCVVRVGKVWNGFLRRKPPYRDAQPRNRWFSPKCCLFESNWSPLGGKSLN